MSPLSEPQKQASIRHSNGQNSSKQRLYNGTAQNPFSMIEQQSSNPSASGHQNYQTTFRAHEETVTVEEQFPASSDDESSLSDFEETHGQTQRLRDLLHEQQMQTFR